MKCLVSALPLVPREAGCVARSVFVRLPVPLEASEVTKSFDLHHGPSVAVAERGSFSARSALPKHVLPTIVHRAEWSIESHREHVDEISSFSLSRLAVVGYR